MFGLLAFNNQKVSARFKVLGVDFSHGVAQLRFPVFLEFNDLSRR